MEDDPLQNDMLLKKIISQLYSILGKSSFHRNKVDISGGFSLREIHAQMREVEWDITKIIYEVEKNLTNNS